jgi:hypothetical protein
MDSTTGKMPLSHTWEINIASLLFSYEVEAGNIQDETGKVFGSTWVRS